MIAGHPSIFLRIYEINYLLQLSSAHHIMWGVACINCQVLEVAAWDGKDGEIVDEEEFDLSDLMNEDL